MEFSRMLEQLKTKSFEFGILQGQSRSAFLLLLPREGVPQSPVAHVEPLPVGLPVLRVGDPHVALKVLHRLHDQVHRRELTDGLEPLRHDGRLQREAGSGPRWFDRGLGLKHLHHNFHKAPGKSVHSCLYNLSSR